MIGQPPPRSRDRTSPQVSRDRARAVATAQAGRELVQQFGTAVVDHTLHRRATLAELRSGRVSAWEVCDAHPHLVAAARHHGSAATEQCPVCRRNQLRWVHFVYGDALKHVAGQAKTPVELRRMAVLSQRARRSFDVYLVEVCGECRWNHLLRSFVIGPGGPPIAGKPPLAGQPPGEKRRPPAARHKERHA